jgi:hypothetical protein
MKKKISILIGAMVAVAMLFGAAKVTTAYAQDGTPATPVAGQDGDKHGHGGRGMGESELAAAATVLGMTSDEISAALKDGKTLYDLAATAGVDIQDVRDARQYRSRCCRWNDLTGKSRLAFGRTR